MLLWKPIPLTRLGFTESIIHFNLFLFFVATHPWLLDATSNGHGSEPTLFVRSESILLFWWELCRNWNRVLLFYPIDQSLPNVHDAWWWSVVCWVYTAVCCGNLSYPGCLEARDAPSTAKYYPNSRGKVWIFTRRCNRVEARHLILGGSLRPTKPEPSHMKNKWSMFDISSLSNIIGWPKWRTYQAARTVGRFLLESTRFQRNPMPPYVQRFNHIGMIWGLRFSPC